MKGGVISTGDLKGLLSKSYSKNPSSYRDYELDPELSGQRVQVYKKRGTNEAFVVHRGSQGIQDWGNDLKSFLGYDISKSNRFKHADDIQKKAEQKYGKENVSTLGHSLGSKIASEVGKDSKEVINLNKYVPPKDVVKPIRSNEYNIRTAADPASLLLPIETKNSKIFTIPSRSLNPLKEHSVDTLDRLPEDTMIGRGHIKKMSVKDLKDLIKRFKDGYRLTGKKKGELVDYCCSKCGV